VESRRPGLEIVQHSYGRLARELANGPRLVAEARGLAERWAALGPEALRLRDFVATLRTSHENFNSAHREALLKLTQIDTKLTQLQLHPSGHQTMGQLDVSVKPTHFLFFYGDDGA